MRIGDEKYIVHEQDSNNNIIKIKLNKMNTDKKQGKWN